jgi:hypothetical protein
MPTSDIPAILRAVGWKTGNDPRRLEIARDWLRENVLWEKTDELRKTFADAGKTFTPAVMTAQNRGVHIEGWLVRYPITEAGPHTVYSRFTADFSAGGEVVQSVAESFEPAQRF